MNQDVNLIAMSDPGLVISSDGGLKGFTSAVIPEEDNKEALIPPPLPPKKYKKPPSHGPQLRALDAENKPLDSLACRSSPLLGGVQGNNSGFYLVTREEQNIKDSSVLGLSPKVEPKAQTQSSPGPRIPPVKPPRSGKQKRAETEETNQKETQEATCSKTRENVGDMKYRHEQGPEDRGETCSDENYLELCKPPGQILALATDKEKDGEEGEHRGEEDEDAPTTPENSTPLVTKAEGLNPEEESNVTATNRKSTPTIPPKPPPKPVKNCPPKPPIKPQRLLNGQWREKDLVDKGMDEKDGEGKDGGDKSTTSTAMQIPAEQEEMVVKSSPTPSLNQEQELPRRRERLCLKLPCRDGLMQAVTAEDETLHSESVYTEKHQNRLNVQIRLGSPPQVPCRISLDSNTETLKGSENNKDIQLSGQGLQDSAVSSKLTAGCQEEAEVVKTDVDPCQWELKKLEKFTGTLSEGELKQTNQKTKRREGIKKLTKMINRLKEGREEKRKIKTGETEFDEALEDDSESKLDERSHGEESGLEDEEKEERTDEFAVYQSAGTEMSSHEDPMERRIRRRNATSESPFGSFKVSSPVRLVEQLFSGVEWSRYLHEDQTTTQDPPPCKTPPEDTGQLNVDLQFDSSAEQDPGEDVFGGDPSVPEEDIYEYIDQSNIIAETNQAHQRPGRTRAPSAAIPKILLESEMSQMSPRTKGVYDTVELIQPVQREDNYGNFSDIKSQGLLCSAVQKYRIKLSKKRKHRPFRKWNHKISPAETRDRAPSSTSPQQVFPTSIFYQVPPSGGDEPLSAVKAGGHSPRTLAKLKMLKTAQPK